MKSKLKQITFSANNKGHQIHFDFENKTHFKLNIDKNDCSQQIALGLQILSNNLKRYHDPR